MSAQRTLSITRLYEDHIEKLKLSWVAAIGIERLVALGDQEVYGPDIVGHLNLIYSHRVQVIGKAEMLWAERVGSERWRRQIEDIMASRPPALIVAEEQLGDVAEDMLGLEGMDKQLAGKLAVKGVKTRDDLADLAIDELTEMTGIDAERAKQLITTARAHWFE